MKRKRDIWFKWADMRRKLARAPRQADMPAVQGPFVGDPVRLSDSQKGIEKFRKALESTLSDAQEQPGFQQGGLDAQDLKVSLLPSTIRGEHHPRNQPPPLHCQPFPGMHVTVRQLVGRNPECGTNTAVDLASWQESAVFGAVCHLPVSLGQPPPAVPAAPAAADALGPDELLVEVVVLQARQNHTAELMEVQLLGSSTLADLRDAISCPTDALAQSAGCSCPSTYFYINGCFYTDLSSREAKDFAARLQALTQQPGFWGPLNLHAPPDTTCMGRQRGSSSASAAAHGPSQTHLGSMASTSFSELVLSISNRPTYLYCHQGCCEHGWYVADVRARAPGDPDLSSQYPRVTSAIPPGERWKCGVCHQPGATKVLLHHPDAPQDLCLVCTSCCELLVPPEGDLPENLQEVGVAVYDLVKLPAAPAVS